MILLRCILRNSCFFFVFFTGKLLELQKNCFSQGCLLVNETFSLCACPTHMNRRRLWPNGRCDDVTCRVLAEICAIILKNRKVLRILRSCVDFLLIPAFTKLRNLGEVHMTPAPSNKDPYYITVLLLLRLDLGSVKILPTQATYTEIEHWWHPW